MHGDEPGSDEVDKVVKEVSIGDTIDSRVKGEKEEKCGGYVAEAVETGQ